MDSSRSSSGSHTPNCLLSRDHPSVCLHLQVYPDGQSSQQHPQLASRTHLSKHRHTCEASNSMSLPSQHRRSSGSVVQPIKAGLPGLVKDLGGLSVHVEAPTISLAVLAITSTRHTGRWCGKMTFAALFYAFCLPCLCSPREREQGELPVNRSFSVKPRFRAASISEWNKEI